MVEISGVTSVFGDTFSGFGSIMYGSIIVILALAVLGFAGWFFWNMKSWKYNVVVLEEGGDGATLVNYDKGRIKKRGDKTAVFRLKKYRKAVIPSPKLNSINTSATGKRTIFLKKFGNNKFDYIPMGIHLRNLSIVVQPFPEGRNNWIQTEFKRSATKYSSFLEKYGTFVMIGSVSLLMIVILIITFKMNGDNAEKFLEASRILGDAINNFNAPAVVEPSPPPVG